MTDRTINMSSAIAYAMWGISVALLGAMWISGERRLGATALLFVGVAMTATIRTYFVEFGKMTRNAYELGRDSVPVVPLRKP